MPRTPHDPARRPARRDRAYGAGLFRARLAVVSAIVVSLVVFNMTVAKTREIALLELMGAKLGAATPRAPRVRVPEGEPRRVAHERGAAVVVVTHDHRTLDAFDTVYEMEDGVLSLERDEAASTG